MNLKARVSKLEKATAPVDVSKLTDAELLAYHAALFGDLADAEKATWRAMTDAELDTLAGMDDRDAGRLFERLVAKYAGEVTS